MPVLPDPVSGKGVRYFRRTWRVWAGVAISFAFLVFAFRGQNFAEIWRALRQANYWYLVPALIFYFAGVWLRAVRWSVLLRPVRRLRGRQLFPVVAVGYMANNVLPLRSGELVRAYVLERRSGVRKTAALATIAIERIFDGITMLGFMLIAATLVPFTSQLRQLAIIAFVIFAVLLIGLFLLTLGGDLRDRLLQTVLGPLPRSLADRVEGLTESFLHGLGVLSRKRDLALVAGTSLLAWSCEATMYWTVARGFGTSLSHVFGVGAALLTTGVANLATLIPSSPGYVGPFETGVVLVVNGALGIDKSLALSYAILLHATLYFPITILGLIEWSRMHLSLRQVRQAEAQPVASDDEQPAAFEQEPRVPPRPKTSPAVTTETGSQ